MARRAKPKAVSDEEIIAAIIAHGTFTAAAAALGICTRTIYERAKKNAFLAEYAAVSKMVTHLTEATDTVAAIVSEEQIMLR